MSKVLSSFILGLISMILILIPLDYYVIVELLNAPFDVINYLTFVYFVLIICIIQFAMMKVLQGRPQSFVPGFMAALGIKMFLTLTILTVLVYLGMVEKKVFGINFAVLYFIFTSFSITHILRAQRSSLEEKN